MFATTTGGQGSEQRIQVVETAAGLVDRAALDGKHDVARRSAADLDHSFPVNHAVAAAHPTGVPVTFPRSDSECSTLISLACRCTSRSATRSSHV